MLVSELREKARKTRLRLNIRQSEVASSLGISVYAYRKFESGKATPRRIRQRMIEVWIEQHTEWSEWDEQDFE